MYKKLIYFSCMLLVLSLTCNSMAELVAYYSMDEGVGETVADGSGNGHDGTISGNPTWVEGPPGFGTAVQFGTEGSMPIDCGMWDNTSGTGEMTVGCWVKFSTGGSTYQGIVSNRTAYNVDQMYWAWEIMGDSGSFYFGSLNGSAYGLGTVPQDQWAHIAITFNGQTIVAYLNGVQSGTSETPQYGNTPASTIRIGSSEAAGNIFQGAIDEVYFLNTILSAEEIVSLMNGEMKPPELNPGGAKMPVPEDQSTNILRDVVLSWEPGNYAHTHNLFLGTDFNDVNNADASSPLLVGPSLTTNSFNPGRLEFGRTYFWRVDEVNAPPDNTVFKGKIWSFTVEPIAYLIPAANIIPTASSNEAGQEPEKTINGSGLDENDLHSINLADMWLSSPGDPGSAWIQYQFDKSYKLHEMLVWNYNGDTILTLYGLKEVKVEYSTDGVNWTQAAISELAQASGSPGYAANTTVSFDGAAAKYVKITANSNYGGGGFFNKYGLSELRFMYIPVSARYPVPENGATDVAIDTSLNWRPGRDAAEHKVYLSTDPQAVTDGTAPATTVNEAAYNPPTFGLSSTYYWRIDEVNNVEAVPTWPGDVWSFSTQEYVVVDDFESYNDIPSGQEGSKLVYETWIDGYVEPPAVRTNGSTIGYSTGASMEPDNIYGGKQAVPLKYDNTTLSLSEVTVDPAKLPIGRNWSIGSPTALVLWIYGDPANTGTNQLYVKIGNAKATYTGDIAKPRWQQWTIDLAAMGANLSNVTAFTIAFERAGATGGSGTVLLDEIRLYGVAPVPPEEVWIEAESANPLTTPFEIFNDPNASGGQYIGKPNTATGTGNNPNSSPAPEATATYSFTVVGGTYRLHLRYNSISQSDGFWVQIPDAVVKTEDGADITLVSGWLDGNNMRPRDAAWQWAYVVCDDVTGDPVAEFTLTAGTHTLKLANRDDGTMVDVIVLTKVD